MVVLRQMNQFVKEDILAEPLGKCDELPAEGQPPVPRAIPPVPYLPHVGPVILYARHACHPGECPDDIAGRLLQEPPPDQLPDPRSLGRLHNNPPLSGVGEESFLTRSLLKVQSQAAPAKHD